VKAPKVIVIGFDGAPWETVSKWAEHGELPTFRRLIKGGSAGVLKSTLPISTSPAWKCYSTGKNPGRFGMFYWFNFDVTAKTLLLTDSRTAKAKEIWDYLTENGYSSAVVDMPTTYPPKKLNGIMVSGFPSFDHMSYTFPERLKGELQAKYGYLVNPRFPLRRRQGTTGAEASRSRDAALAEAESIIKSRFSFARDLLRRGDLDFLHLTVFLIDNVQHYLWGPMVFRDGEYGQTLLGFWKLLDAELDELLELVDLNQTRVFIMSDHGATFLKARFRFNNWLERRGDLGRRNGGFSFSGALFRLGLSRETAQRYASTRVGRLLSKLIPYGLTARMWLWLRVKQGEANEWEVTSSMDWSRTRAAMVGESLLYVNLPRDDPRYEAYREELAGAIKQMKDPEDGASIAGRVLKSDEFYSGPYLREAPDLLVEPAPGYSFDISLSADGLWERTGPDTDYSSFHTSDGLLIANGPEIPRGVRLEGASLYDIAPTILRIYGLEYPGEFDGRNLFDSGNAAIRRETGRAAPPEQRKAFSPEDEAKVMERLKDLGYV
jgi:predicted AlkP superfamily phosphohydrolase/phosphomutase